MKQSEFDELSEKFLAGNCTPAELAILQKWADAHYEEQSQSQLFATEQEETNTGDKLWAPLEIAPERKNRFTYPLRLAAGIAASVLLIWTGISYFKPNNLSPAKTTEPSTAEVSTPGFSSRVTLPDGSIVVLEEGADIVTDVNFGIKDRRVILKGEAFFDVKPNKQLPFIVQTDDLVTEVLGTSFRIQPREKKIEVSVVTGKVSVYTSEPKGGKQKDGVIALPNQKVSYDLISKTLRQNLVDTPQPIVKITKPAELSFDETSVSEVFSKISEIYGVQLITGSPAIASCTFTGDLAGLDMYRQIEAICQVVGIKYEVRGTAIFVTGSGCQ